MEFIDLKSQYLAAREEIDARIHAVLAHGQYIMGPEVAELEQELATFSGARHCITVASGTEALIIALMALDIGHGHYHAIFIHRHGGSHCADRGDPGVCRHRSSHLQH
jgi:dTDP-4-amino-4,6-dideoxygalactose transaminase